MRDGRESDESKGWVQIVVPAVSEHLYTPEWGKVSSGNGVTVLRKKIIKEGDK